MIVADGEVVQLSLAHASEMIRHAAGTPGQNDIIAVEFDPRRELMFWIESEQSKVYRSALPKGLFIPRSRSALFCVRVCFLYCIVSFR